MSRFKRGDKVVVVKPMPLDFTYGTRFKVGTVWTVDRPSNYEEGIYVTDPTITPWYPDEYFDKVDDRTTVDTLKAQVDSLRRQGYTVEVKITPPPVVLEEIVL
jgi:hypothetical protein